MGMKGTMLCESNIIQRHNEERGKEILKAGGSVAFANMAQKRMEFGNGSQGSTHTLQQHPEGFGNGGQGVLVPTEGAGGEAAVVPAPVPERAEEPWQGQHGQQDLLPAAQLEMSPAAAAAGLPTHTGRAG